MSDETSIKINRTAAATAARMKTSDEKAAAKLRARGWVCVEPELAAQIPLGVLGVVKA